MGRVLIVEDNELNLKLFCDLLIIQNHEVIMSRDGLNIIEIVTKQKPDLILMDIQLNGVSGMDLIRSLKKNLETKKIPIIAVTAFAMKNDEAKISESGCDFYISKPVSVDHFFSTVKRFIEGNEI